MSGGSFDYAYSKIDELKRWVGFMMTIEQLLGFVAHGGPRCPHYSYRTPIQDPVVTSGPDGTMQVMYEVTPQQLARYAQDLFLFECDESGKMISDEVRHAKTTTLLGEQCPNFRDYLVEHAETGLDDVVRKSWVARPFPTLTVRGR
jgi:hypothetical protein